MRKGLAKLAFIRNGPKKAEPPQALDGPTIRNHWSKAVVFTGSWEGKEGKEVPAERLLPSELSAVLFQVGCYTVRSAQRVYQICEPGYSPERETPASSEEVELVQKDIAHNANRLGLTVYGGYGWSPWQNRLRVTHEISARHQDSPDSLFTVICRAAQSRDGGISWSERITAVLTAKKHLAVPGKSASLFVCNRYVGSSFSSDTWYKLDPDGKTETLSLHPFNSDADKARFH